MGCRSTVDWQVILYNRDKFFASFRTLIGNITDKQTEAIEFLLEKLENSKRIETHPKRAYVLATTAWETAYTYRPITEYGSEKYLTSKAYYPYIGRGYVQLTWKENYLKFGKALGLDLVNNPNLANTPIIAWQILEMGMTNDMGVQDPDFTKWTLEDFFDSGKCDYFNARKIINPKDYKTYKPIADLAEKFHDCLISSIITEENIPDPKGTDNG